MIDQIKVHVVRYSAQTNLIMRYRDPVTGRQVVRSTGTPKKRDAERAAAKWEAELREGRYQKPSRVTWEEFREQYSRDVLDGLKPSTATTYDATLNVFERLRRPVKLVEVTTTNLTAFVTDLRAQVSSPATIARHLRALMVAMRWAHREGLLLKLPEVSMPKQAKGMRGRPLAGEEYERMLDAVANVVGEAASSSWKFYLRGLWASGLRLQESIELRWDDAPGAMVVDFSGRRPMLRIPAESEKGNTHRLLPMAPEFAQLLEEVPVENRRGRVFAPLDKSALPYSPSRNAIGPLVTEIGEAAGVIVNQRVRRGKDGKPETVKKFASAHDLRRSFGFRWSRRVMPPVLKELMRHTEIATTMKYYVGLNAEATADELWRVAGITSGISAEKESAETSDENRRKSLKPR
ncbi:tyrosine-type recombinase/integrase [Lacipirellula sp.]|uniref:tyrosine-type recombinase/integrase n=1 Tax=Lacipirellula sp. TaxID=2691419 RepID=UPI003D12D908